MNTSIIDHLKSRHVDLDLHRPIVDEEAGLATFLLYNLSGQITGYQQYRPWADKQKKNNPREGRYFTYRNRSMVTVFGLESVHLTPSLVFVTEGIFDAVRLTERGVSALAALSNDPTLDVRNFLTCLGRRVIVVCDADKAGRKLARLGHDVVYTADKDLGDSAEEFVDELVKKFV